MSSCSVWLAFLLAASFPYLSRVMVLGRSESDGHMASSPLCPSISCTGIFSQESLLAQLCSVRDLVYKGKEMIGLPFLRVLAVLQVPIRFTCAQSKGDVDTHLERLPRAMTVCPMMLGGNVIAVRNVVRRVDRQEQNTSDRQCGQERRRW